MKLKFITNASAVYESKGYKLLSDPWLTEPIFYGTWYHDPPIKTKPEDVLDVDALYISHIHPDHLDEATLRSFLIDRKSIPIFTLKDRHSFCAKHLTKMGFTQVIACEPEYRYEVGPFTLIMFGPFAKHPHHECEIGNIVDSALYISDGKHSVLNTNDNTPTVDKALAFAKEYGILDLVQLNYNNAGPYPACFDNLTHEEKLDEHHRSIKRNLEHLLKLANAFDARAVMPFAGSYKLGGDVEHLNQYLGTTSAAHAGKYLTSYGFKAVVLEENQEYYF